MTEISIRRIYQAPKQSDGQRILVDRIWPRGISKDKAQLTLWLKEIAPSKELRQWFNHEPDKWPEFQHRYRKELNNNPEAVAELQARLAKGPVTLLYSARDEAHNQALALKAYLEQRQTDPK